MIQLILRFLLSFLRDYTTLYNINNPIVLLSIFLIVYYKYFTKKIENKLDLFKKTFTTNSIKLFYITRFHYNLEYVNRTSLINNFQGLCLIFINSTKKEKKSSIKKINKVA